MSTKVRVSSVLSALLFLTSAFFLGKHVGIQETRSEVPEKHRITVCLESDGVYEESWETGFTCVLEESPEEETSE